MRKSTFMSLLFVAPQTKFYPTGIASTICVVHPIIKLGAIECLGKNQWFWPLQLMIGASIPKEKRMRFMIIESFNLQKIMKRPLPCTGSDQVDMK